MWQLIEAKAFTCPWRRTPGDLRDADRAQRIVLMLVDKQGPHSRLLRSCSPKTAVAIANDTGLNVIAHAISKSLEAEPEAD